VGRLAGGRDGQRRLPDGPERRGQDHLPQDIMGLLPARAGRITLDGVDLAGRRPEETRGCGHWLRASGREVFPNLTVRENLRIGELGRRSSRRQGAAASFDDLDSVFELFRS